MNDPYSSTCSRPSSVRWMVTHLLGWAPLVVIAVMSESSSSFFSFSFFTRLSMARLANVSLSPPCLWHIRLCTMLRQASLLVGVLVIDILIFVSGCTFLRMYAYVVDTVSHHQEAGAEMIFTESVKNNSADHKPLKLQKERWQDLKGEDNMQVFEDKLYSLILKHLSNILFITTNWWQQSWINISQSIHQLNITAYMKDCMDLAIYCRYFVLDGISLYFFCVEVVMLLLCCHVAQVLMTADDV